METKITYTLLDENLNSIPENEVFSDADLNLIDNYQINKEFDFTQNLSRLQNTKVRLKPNTMVICWLMLQLNGTMHF